MRTWNGWYHVTGNTYGTWLRGDRRGWRTRWHREHVDGDYKNPPPAGTFEDLEDRSRNLLKQAPVYLNARRREIAGRAMVEKLIEIGMEVLAVSLDSHHYHLLAMFHDDEVRGPVGRAKKNASHALTRCGLAGTVWARKCRALPISDRRHQLNSFRYIVEHTKRGAWVWTFREQLDRSTRAPGRAE